MLIIAGPCAIESEEQMLQTAKVVKECGVGYLRAGAYKPRTSPHSFQGLGQKGLEIASLAAKIFKLKTVTEVMDTRDVELVAKHADVLQIGSRNMQNFALLKEVGRSKMPIILKRGLAATVSEWLSAAEYIEAEGNTQIILCERGIRTFCDHMRNTLDLSVVPYIKKYSKFPIIVDPSHATGESEFVIPMAKAALAAGCDGLMLEIHPQPEKAMCDGQQSLTLEQFKSFMIKEHLFAKGVEERVSTF